MSPFAVMPTQGARYDSPTQTGGFDSDGGDGWFDYDAQQEQTDSEPEGQLMGNNLSRPYTPNDPRLYSPSRALSGRSSSLSFSVLDPANYDDDFPPLDRAVFSPITESDSPPPLGDDVFAPDTPSNDLPQPWRDLSPLPPLSEWFSQPLYDILTLPPNDIPASPPPAQSVLSSPTTQQRAAVNDAHTASMQQSIHELTLSQFFDEEGVREITEALARQQRQADEQSEETEEQSVETEERYILREEDIDLNAIRERSVMDIRFATEMPTPEPEAQPAAAPQSGYIPPPPFIPPYTHFSHEPTVNDGRLPHQVEALEYLCAALFVNSDRLKWSMLHRPVECFNQLVGMTTYCHATKRFSTVAHMTALTPETHVSVTGHDYTYYLREHFNCSIAHYDLPMVELSDGFLAPLEILTLYYHI